MTIYSKNIYDDLFVKLTDDLLVKYIDDLFLKYIDDLLLKYSMRKIRQTSNHMPKNHLNLFKHDNLRYAQKFTITSDQRIYFSTDRFH